MLEVIGVSHRSGRETVLERASLKLAPGRALVLLAPAGRARLALLRLMAGQEKPQNGTVRFGGEDASRSRALKGGTFWVRSGGADPVGRRIEAVIGSAARKGGAKGRAVAEAAARAAAAAGVGARLDANVKSLDLEGRIRVALACALAARPKLLLLEEPLAGLAADVKQRVLADMAGLLAQLPGAVVAYATASPEEGRWIGQEMAVLDGGRVTQSGGPADVLDHPRDIATARATSQPQLNVLTVVWDGAQRRLADGSLFTPPAGVDVPAAGFTLAFRPGEAGMARTSDDAVRFMARATGMANADGASFVRVIVAGTEWLIRAGETEPAAGLMLNVFVDRARLMVFGEDGAAFALVEARAAS